MSDELPSRPLPETNFLMVGFPAQVLNVEKALQTLGGLPALQKAYSSQETFLPLNLRPENPHSHPLFGDRVPSSNLLLRVRKSSTKLDHEIIGKIATTYAFQGLADFQYIPPKDTYKNEARIEPNKRSLEMPSGVALSAAPMIFSKLDYPLPYYFRHNPAFKKEEMPDGTSKWVSVNQRKKLSTYMISIRETNLPKNSHHPIQKSWLPVINRLKELFSQRPIWTRPGLLLNIPPSQHKYMKVALPCVAFYFIDGPWRLCWVKIGYDPKKHQDAGMYQTIDFRIGFKPKKVAPAQSHTEVIKRKRPMRLHVNPDVTASEIEGTEAKQHNIKEKPKLRSNRVFQLIDLKHDRFTQILSEAAFAEFQTDGGWYDKLSLKVLRREVKRRIAQILAEDPSVEVNAVSISNILQSTQIIETELDQSSSEESEEMSEGSLSEDPTEFGYHGQDQDSYESEDESVSQESVDEEDNEFIPQDEVSESDDEDPLQVAKMLIEKYQESESDSVD